MHYTNDHRNQDQLPEFCMGYNILICIGLQVKPPLIAALISPQLEIQYTCLMEMSFSNSQPNPDH